jgi:hypothetical protein
MKKQEEPMKKVNAIRRSIKHMNAGLCILVMKTSNGPSRGSKVTTASLQHFVEV